MNSFRKAHIYVRNNFAGLLEETDEGYRFTYDENYLQSEFASPVSLTLPLQSSIYDSNTLISFFCGLMQKGWLLDIVSRNWKISPNDRFGLLLVACKDSIGNVSVREESL